MIPVSIVTGFLGSGKTTLLNQLLQCRDFRNSLVIVNELGEIGIDHLLVSAPTENTWLLSSDCLCCEVRGELFETLTDIVNNRASGEIPPFDRILVETTGLADPVPILRTIVTDDTLTPYFRMDRVITVVDAVHAHQQLINHDEARKQVAVSDILLLSKVDLIEPDSMDSVAEAVNRINAGSPLIPVDHGRVEPEVLFSSTGRDAQDLGRWLAHDLHGHTHHTGEIGTLSLTYDEPVSESGLATWLSMLTNFKSAQLLRVKGIVNVGGYPYAIHVVQSVVHPPVPLDAWPSSSRQSRFVFIGRDLEEATLESSLAAFSLADTLEDTFAVNPAVYARFREAAERLL